MVVQEVWSVLLSLMKMESRGCYSLEKTSLNIIPTCNVITERLDTPIDLNEWFIIMLVRDYHFILCVNTGSVKDNMGPFSRGGLVYVRGLCKGKFWRAGKPACKCLLIYCSALLVHSCNFLKI